MAEFTPDPQLLDAIARCVEERQPAGQRAKRRGDELTFLCPAHDDSRPSAGWNAKKGVWICRVCGVGGGALDLAERLGLDTVRPADGHAGRSDRPAPEPPAAPLPSDEFLAKAAERLTTSDLPEAVAAREWLQSRGINPACGWGISKLADKHLDTYRLPAAAVGVRLLVPVSTHDHVLLDVRRYAAGPLGEGVAAEAKLLPWAAGHGRALPYGWDRIGDADPIVWCEGEADCETLRAAGLPAVTNTCGAGSAALVARERLPAELLTGRRFCCLFDRDAAGDAGATKLAAALHARGARVSIASWPADAPEGYDAGDWYADGADTDALRAVIEAAKLFEPEEVDAPDRADEGDGRRGKPQATVLYDLAVESGAEPFCDPGGAFWLAAPVDGHIVAVPIGEKSGVSRWLRRLYQRHHGRLPSTQAVADVAAMLAAFAEEGPTRPVHVRVARHGGAVYLDLGRDDRQVAEVTADGWQVVPCPAGLYYRRPKDGRELADPAPGGDLRALAELLGDRIECADQILIAAWLLGTLQPDAPYPILHLTGEAGAGKSSLARLLAEVVDTAGANRDATVGAPRDEEALAVRAVGRHVIALDNLSRLSAAMSDAVCRLSTGGPVSRRQLYTDFEEASVYLRRPVILTGIGDVATRGDLADRCLTVTLPPIGTRRDEAELWRDADRLLPSILGGLLTAASAALRHRDAVTGPLHRMADWARWCLAATIGGVVPWSEAEFREALAGTREAAAGAVLDASPLPALLAELLDQEGGQVELRPSELLAALDQLADGTTRARRDWPSDATRLSGALRAVAPALREAGRIDLTQRKSNGRKLWRLSRITVIQGSLTDLASDPAATLATLSDPASDPAQTRSTTETTVDRVARVAEPTSSSVGAIRKEGEGCSRSDGKGSERSELETSDPSDPADFDPFDPDLPMNRGGEEGDR